MSLDDAGACAFAEALLNSALDAVIYTDATFTVLQWNRAAEQMYGWTASEAIGKTMGELVPTRYPTSKPEDVKAHFVTRGAWSGEAIQTRRDGDELYVHASVSLVTGPDGKPVGVLAINRDVTQQRREQERLEAERQTILDRAADAQHLEALGRLAGGVAHDFNNLMTIIRTYTRFVADGLPVGTPLRADIEEIQNAEQRASALTRQLLSFSRQAQAPGGEVALNDGLHKLGQMITRVMPQRIRLRYDLSDSVQRVLIDGVRLDQIVMNLAINARDAMPGGGTIRIKTAHVPAGDPRLDRHPGLEQRDYALLEVSDEGVGMSRETSERIFEPFFTTKPTGQGTGLGLATVYGAVRHVGGAIEVDSGLGTGTTFRLFLPHAPGEVETPARSKRRRILVVDDEAMVCRLIERILSAEGYEVVTANNGEQALARFEADGGAFDLVVTDVVMPKLGGIELANQLARRFDYHRVLFVSGYAADTTGLNLANPKAPFVAKPFDPDVLLSATRKTFEVYDHLGGRFAIQAARPS